MDKEIAEEFYIWLRRIGFKDPSNLHDYGNGSYGFLCHVNQMVAKNLVLFIAADWIFAFVDNNMTSVIFTPHMGLLKNISPRAAKEGGVMDDELDDMANDPDIQRELAAIRAEEQGHAGMYQDSSGNWRALDALYGSEPEHPADVRHETTDYWRERAERAEAALDLSLTLLENGMTWLEFEIFCQAQEWDSDALLAPYVDENIEAPSFTTIVAREFRQRLALAKGQGE